MSAAEQRRAPAANRGPENRCDGDESTLARAADTLPHFARRVLQDAVNEALARTWERRAAALEWARPLPTDYMGQRTPGQARAKYAELTAVARACRARAAVSRSHEGVDDDVRETLC